MAYYCSAKLCALLYIKKKVAMNRKSGEWERNCYRESLLQKKVIVTFLSHKFGFFTIHDRSMPENTILSSGNPSASSEIICKMCLRQNCINNTAFKNRNRPKNVTLPYFPVKIERKKLLIRGLLPPCARQPLKFNHLCQW